MILWELHDALARGLEDPLINIDGTNYNAGHALSGINVPDGTRYTTAIRNDYLYRAMKSVMSEARQAIISLPYRKASQILERIFPTMIYDLVFRMKDLGNQLSGKYWVLNVTLSSGLVRDGTGSKVWADKVLAPNIDIFSSQNTQGNVVIYRPDQTINLPIMLTSQIDEIAPNYIDNHNAVAMVVAYDDYVWLGLAGKDIKMYAAADLLPDNHPQQTDAWINLRYIHDCPDTRLLNAYTVLPQGGYEITRVEFEPAFESTIINRALVMAHHDSGELGASYQSVPFLENLRTISGENDGSK